MIVSTQRNLFKDLYMSNVDDLNIHGIFKLLVEDKLIDLKSALKYQNEALANKTSLLEYLVFNKIIPAITIAKSISKNLCLPLFDLNSIELDKLPLSLISDKLIRKHNVLPLFTRDSQLYLAIDDPSKESSLKEVQFHTGLYVNPLIVETDKLLELINKLFLQKEKEVLTSYLRETQEISIIENEQNIALSSIVKEDPPVVKFINQILIDAIKKDVSDIHFEPYEKTYRIRYRQEGILNEVASPPLNLSNRIAACIKIMANLDISERRIPQDGGFKMKLSQGQSIDIRVSSCPTLAGEKLVLRILDSASTKLKVEDLGFSKLQKENFLRAINRPQGMILVTGPTGCGKTVTLYSALNILNTIKTNICTAEDPVEINLPGINQVNINHKAGLTFSTALRSFLRQDPDIIMVGEIRDLETAEIAIKAAHTGHLVLSTLHTNSAAETLTRLSNMGIPSFNIASSINLIIAQRLIRKLCEFCKTIRHDLTERCLIELGFSKEEHKNIIMYKANECNQCSGGYRGRVGLFEVMPITKAIENLIMNKGNSQDILKQAISEGMLSIYQAGLDKIKEGITTIEEVNRVTVE